MISDFPKAYRVVRQGRLQLASVAGLDELVTLRTELELVRRFGAGASPELIAVLDQGLTRGPAEDGSESGIRAEQVRTLEDMRTILCDAMASANARAVAEMDETFPEIRTGIPMDSINRDSKQFRQEVIEQAKQSDVDVEAMLAAFEQAAVEESESASPPADERKDDPLDDAAVDALLARTAETSIPLPEVMAESAPPPAVELNDTVDTDSTAEPEPATVDNQADLTTEPTDTTVSIEAVSEQVAETLTHAEQQLDAIASAFEVAAAELGQMTAETQQAAAGPAPSGICEALADQAKPDDREDLEQLAALTAWESELEPTCESQPASEAEPTPAEPQPDAIKAGQCQSEAATCLGPGCQPPRTVEAGLRPCPTKTEFGTTTIPLQPCSTPTGTTAGVKAQIQQARNRILSELDEVLALLERVGQMQAHADQSLAKAKSFEQAAARAHETSQVLAEAEAEAAKAQTMFEQAQLRVSSARQFWEQARQDASAAAAAAHQSR